MEKHKVIYLQPECDACHDNIDLDTGQLWCQDDVWTGACEECGEPVESIKYSLVG